MGRFCASRPLTQLTLGSNAAFEKRASSQPSGLPPKPPTEPTKRTLWGIQRLGTMSSNEGLQQASGYRRNVGICLINGEGLVFAGRRMSAKGHSWQMPQGGIDGSEDVLAAAKRELYEETGITSARVLHTLESWLAYDFPTAVRDQMTGSIKQYKGQMQKWVLMSFHGKEHEIDLDASGEREFADYSWMPLEELSKRIVPFKVEVYKRVAEEFGPLIHQHIARQDGGNIQ